MSFASKFKNKFIGDKAFYKMVITLIVPIIVQSLITNFVNLLDNIMVGQVGTAQMSGVAIANQLMFVFQLALFGALSGVGIFTAQYFGAQDEDGVRASIRLKLAIGIVLCGLFILAASLWGKELISLFLTDSDDPAEVEVTLTEGLKYLRIALVGVVPFMLSQVYASSLKEGGETRLPMRAGIAAVLTNLVGNYILIYGKLGAPVMGVSGASIATVISRFLEAFILIWFPSRQLDRFPYLGGLFRSLRIPGDMLKKVAIKGTPLMINELLWSTGMSAITQSYSTRGLAAVAAVNINSTVFNLFSTVYFSFGTVIAIVVGQALGAGELKKARDLDNKVIFFSIMLSLAVGAVAFVLAPLFPQLYNTTEEVRDLATSLLRVSCICMPIGCTVHCCYFTLRTGGKTIITFLFDCVFVLAVAFPVSFVLSRFTDISLVPLYLVIQLLDLLKIAIGMTLVVKGVWIQNLVKD